MLARATSSSVHRLAIKPGESSTRATSVSAKRCQRIEVITIYGILGLPCKEALRMAHLQFTDVQDRPTEFLDLTSLTLDEFQQLVPPFEAAFQTHMAMWRLDGKPRTARRFTVYTNCPLPTPEDQLLFILAYLKTYALQVVQGRLFGMGQSKANQWIHVLLPVLLAALRALGDAPARSLAALAQRLGVSEADAATVVIPVEEERPPLVAAPAVVPTSPLLPMTAPSGASSSFSVIPGEAACMINAWPTRRRIPCPQGAGCCRIWVSWPSRCPTWQSSCRPRNPVARS